MSGMVEKQFEVAGKTYTAAFSFGSMRRAERELGGQSLPVLFAQGRVGFDVCGVLLWAALQRDHKMTMERVDALIDSADNPEEILKMVIAAFAEYSGSDAPQPETDEPADDAEGEGEPDPLPEKPKGKGKGST